MTNKYDIKALDNDCYPLVTVAPDSNHDVTHEQKTSLFRKWKQDDQGMSWVDFAQSAAISADKVVMVQWCGMWLGIETDGYCHS